MSHNIRSRNQPRAETRAILLSQVQYPVKESPRSETRTILYKWNQPRVETLILYHNIWSGNQPGAETRTISLRQVQYPVKESPRSETRTILYEWNQLRVETLIWYHNIQSRNQPGAEPRTISWMRVQYQSRNHL